MTGSPSDLSKQADRAEGLADQTVDKEVAQAFREAAKQYRDEAERDSNRDDIETKPDEAGPN